jgi:hypothetical protein
LERWESVTLAQVVMVVVIAATNDESEMEASVLWVSGEDHERTLHRFCTGSIMVRSPFLLHMIRKTTSLSQGHRTITVGFDVVPAPCHNMR